MGNNILSAIERSASTGRKVALEGMGHLADVRGLIDDGLALLSESDDGVAMVTGHDPDDRPFAVRLVDIYAHELLTY